MNQTYGHDHSGEDSGCNAAPQGVLLHQEDSTSSGRGGHLGTHSFFLSSLIANPLIFMVNSLTANPLIINPLTFANFFKHFR